MRRKPLFWALTISFVIISISVISFRKPAPFVNLSAADVLYHYQNEHVNGMAISQDGRFLVVSTWPGIINLHEFSSNRDIVIVESNRTRSTEEAVLAIHPTRPLVVFETDDNSVQIVDVLTLRKSSSRKVPGIRIAALAVSPAGDKLAVLSIGESTIMLFLYTIENDEFSDVSLLAEFRLMDIVLRSVGNHIEFSADSTSVALPHLKGCEVISTLTKKRGSLFPNDSITIADIAYSPDARIAVCLESRSSNVHLLRLDTGLRSEIRIPDVDSIDCRYVFLLNQDLGGSFVIVQSKANCCPSTISICSFEGKGILSRKTVLPSMAKRAIFASKANILVLCDFNGGIRVIDINQVLKRSKRS